MQYDLYLERRLQCHVFNAASPFITELPECSLSCGSTFAFKFPSFCIIDTPSKHFSSQRTHSSQKTTTLRDQCGMRVEGL